MQLWNSQNTPKNASESVSYLPEIRFRPGGFAPLVPLPGLCPGPTWGPRRPPDPSPVVLPHCSGPSYAPAPQKSSITQRLRADLKWSVGVTTTTKLVWFTGFTGSTFPI